MHTHTYMYIYASKQKINVQVLEAATSAVMAGDGADWCVDWQGTSWSLLWEEEGRVWSLMCEDMDELRPQPPSGPPGGRFGNGRLLDKA